MMKNYTVSSLNYDTNKKLAIIGVDGDSMFIHSYTNSPDFMEDVKVGDPILCSVVDISNTSDKNSINLPFYFLEELDLGNIRDSKASAELDEMDVYTNVKSSDISKGTLKLSPLLVKYGAAAQAKGEFRLQSCTKKMFASGTGYSFKVKVKDADGLVKEANYFPEVSVALSSLDITETIPTGEYHGTFTVNQYGLQLKDLSPITIDSEQSVKNRKLVGIFNQLTKEGIRKYIGPVLTELISKGLLMDLVTSLQQLYLLEKYKHTENAGILCLAVCAYYKTIGGLEEETNKEHIYALMLTDIAQTQLSIYMKDLSEVLFSQSSPKGRLFERLVDLC